MGCNGSKLDDLQAVALCRDRSQYLADAIRHRYALAEAHASYVQSLRSVGLSLHRFFLVSESIPPSSPVLTLSGRRKCDPHPLPPLSPSPPPLDVAAPIASANSNASSCRYSCSNSGSHIQLHSSDEYTDDDDDSHIHSCHSSPSQSRHFDSVETTTSTTTYYNYARKGPAAASVTYEQRPFSPDVVPIQVGTFGGGNRPSSSSSYPYYYGYPYPNQSANYYGNANNGYPYTYPYPYPPAYGYGGMGGSSVFRSSLSPQVTEAPPQPAARSSSSRSLRPPPSPPRASSWDFLNPFESYDSYQPVYTPSWSSREVREQEGIPELEEEEEEEEQEFVKEAHLDQRFANYMAATSSSAANVAEVYSSSRGSTIEEEEDRRSIGEELHYPLNSCGAREVIEKEVQGRNVADVEVQRRKPEEKAQKKVVAGSRAVQDVVHEIKKQFDMASMSCKEVSKLLEVGKLPYHRRKYEVSSKMMYTVTPCLSTATCAQSSSTKIEELSECSSSGYLEFDYRKVKKCRKLSTTLQWLYIWEKKLHEEVRAEEKMRILHDKKCKQLRYLDEKGAEPHKVESTQDLINKLSTKIRVSIQVVNSISNRLNKLRDEELWPQLNELIQGLVKMWQVMLECHRSQYHAIVEAKGLDAVASASAGKLSDAHMEATMQLLLELLNWIASFSSWIDTQKCYVKALNGWLRKCLLYEPEETADGISPGRLGAPTVFVMCKYWSEAIESISEREVVEAMQGFATSVLQVWQQHYTERRHRMMANQDMAVRLKALDREDHKIHKAVETVNRRCARISGRNGFLYTGEITYWNHVTEPSSLQSGLQQIFEAMESFTNSCMKAYEGLCIRCEEERVAKENARVP